MVAGWKTKQCASIACGGITISMCVDSGDGSNGELIWCLAFVDVISKIVMFVVRSFFADSFFTFCFVLYCNIEKAEEAKVCFEKMGPYL